MTAQHALIQLLKLAPLQFSEIVTYTGWNTLKVRQTLAGLREAEKVQHSGGYCGFYSV